MTDTAQSPSQPQTSPARKPKKRIAVLGIICLLLIAVLVLIYLIFKSPLSFFSQQEAVIADLTQKIQAQATTLTKITQEQHRLEESAELLQQQQQALTQTVNALTQQNQKALLTDQEKAQQEQILLQLSAISTQIPLLPLQIQLPPTHNATPATETEAASATWEQQLEKTWQELKEVIRVQHQPEPILPFLTVTEHELLVENIQLLLQQAGLTLLQGQPQLFTLKLQEARGWIERYLDTNNPATQQVLTQLNELTQTFPQKTSHPQESKP